MSKQYKLVYAKKAELTTRKGEIVFLTSKRDAARYSLTPDQYALAKLFDGTRSEDEVRALFSETHGVELSDAEFREFMTNLEQAHLLQDASILTHRSANISHLPHRAWPRTGGEFGDNDPSMDDALPILEGELAAETTEEAWMRPAEGGDNAEIGAPTRLTRAGAAGTFSQEVKLLVRLPIGWLMPLGKLMMLPVRSRAVLALVLIADLVAGFGLWFNRVDVTRDLFRLIEPLVLAQTLLLSMLSVNLLGQLARAAAAHYYSGKRPPFGIALAFNVLPRFYTSLSEHHGLLGLEQRRGILASSLYVNFTLFALMSYSWLMTKDGGTYLPLLFVGIAALCFVRFALSINPLAKRAGYYLLSARLGIPLLRERALLALIRRNRGDASGLLGARQVSIWALRLYGVLVVAWLITFAVVITSLLGGWLETHWGGLGVIVFLALAVVALYGPIRHVQAVRRKHAEAQQPVQADSASGSGRTTLRRNALAAGLLIILAVVAMLPYTYEPGGEFELLPLPDRRVDVRAQIEAQINEVLVNDGEQVVKGQPLARLSDDEEQKNIAIAQATIEQLSAELAKAETGPTKEQIAASEQRVQTARSNYRFSKNEAQRYASLHEKGTVSTQQYEDTLAKADKDRELLTQAEKDLQLLLAGVRQEDIAAIKARIAQQTALLEYYRQRLEYTQLRAPISGRIASGTLLSAAGNYLERGDLFAVVEDDKSLLAEIKIPQADIAEVRVGAKVRIKTWAYPNREFTGVVQSIAPTANDTPYGKVVRVMTQIDNSEGLLKTSLSGQAKVIGEQKPVIVAFSRMLMRFFHVEFWSWLP